MSKILDNVRNQQFDEHVMRECPNPKIIEKYGQNGKCMVSVYTCLRCKRAVHYQWHGGISCGYGKKKEGEDNQKGAETKAKGLHK